MRQAGHAVHRIPDTLLRQASFEATEYLRLKGTTCRSEPGRNQSAVSYTALRTENYHFDKLLYGGMAKGLNRE
jgi:hypothetical protein